MNINRNNYEVFFILYVDNELSITERKLVEEFVQANSDLQEELVMLQQSKLVPDQAILFDRKESLMKGNTDHFINLSNYEEQFLLYIDNELSLDQKIKLEQFLAQNPSLQKELEILQRTILPSEDVIIFPNKELLYKKEKDQRPFPLPIGIGWLRMAVAAVVIFAIGLGTFIILNNDAVKPANEVVTNGKANENKKVEVVDRKQNPQTIPVPDNDRAVVAAIERNKIEAVKKPVEKIKQNKTNTIAANNNNSIVSLNKNKEKEIDDIAKVDKPITDPVNTMDLPSAEKNDPKHIINKSGVTTEISESYDIADASNKKLRGFFRKATRIFERATNISATDEDSKLLVGAFAINLK